MINSIFEDKPITWGLRGDPYLWDEISQHFKNSDETLSSKEFKTRLELFFYKFIFEEGKKVTNEIVHIPSFPKEGMSGGRISVKWWLDKGFPLLCERYNKLI